MKTFKEFRSQLSESTGNQQEDEISKALDHPDRKIRLAAISHPDITPEHISKALDDKYDQVRLKAIRQTGVNRAHIRKALDDENTHIRDEAWRRHKELNFREKPVYGGFEDWDK